MSYSGYITRIKNVRKHTNADRLQVAEVFGNFVIVGLDAQENDLGFYLPTDGKVGIEFAKENKLLREKDAEGNQVGGYLDPERRHISSIKLRGEKSDGIFLSLKSLDKFTDISTLKEGEMITTLNGVLICEKYIPRGKIRSSTQGTPRIKKIERESFPYFQEHIDTSQLAYNLQQFRTGDNCRITLKQHGTSQRTAYTIKETPVVLPKIIHKVLKFLNVKIKPKVT
jgi:tRNA-binding EMAP/Myf-like protein